MVGVGGLGGVSEDGYHPVAGVHGRPYDSRADVGFIPFKCPSYMDFDGIPAGAPAC